MSLPSAVKAALDRLEACGFEAYVVGGCVRDSLLGRVPNDWDITTNARPEQTARAFADCRVIETGIKHGTVGVLLDGMLLEITTYRCDGAYLDNRHPESVTFSSRVEDDLSRRDFTVNAMAYHPERGLVDRFGGRADLQSRVIRCVGEPVMRFEEDGLRILRAIRFAAVLNFSIEEGTERAIKACRMLLSNIAAERVREELCKLICGVGAEAILREYIDVIAVFFPELARCVGFDQNTKYHCYDVFEHTLCALSLNTDGDLVTRLSILLHDIGKPLCYTEDAMGGHFKGHAAIGVEITETVLRRLRFDNDTIERVKLLVELHDLPISPERRAVKRLMQKLSDADILRLLEIKRCDRMAHAEFFRQLPPELSLIPALMQEIRTAEDCLSLKSLAVKGDDLIALGIPAGKRIGELLNALLDAVLDERLPNEKTALLDAAKKMVK
ncbi:MAG: HD domain-containing protein [Clostridia bacterium]|nr:HD domain-containing protein [Clostridia bacterium]